MQGAVKMNVLHFLLDINGSASYTLTKHLQFSKHKKRSGMLLFGCTDGMLTEIR